jgi:hypothetical protein
MEQFELDAKSPIGKMPPRAAETVPGRTSRLSEAVGFAEVRSELKGRHF